MFSRKILLWAVALFCVKTGCFSQGDDNAAKDLDVPIVSPSVEEKASPRNRSTQKDKLTAKGANAAASGSQNSAAASGSQNSAAASGSGNRTQKDPPKQSARIGWQQFFAPPPDPEKFSNLKAKLQTWPQETEAKKLLQKARAHNMVGQINAAEATYRRLIRLHDSNIKGHLELAQLYLKTNRIDKCFSYLKATKDIFDSKEFPDQNMLFQYRYTLALAFIKKGNRKDGHLILSDLINLDKSFTPGYAAMASSYLQLDKIKAAKFIAKRGLDRGLEDPRLTNILGVIAKKEHNPIEARRWFDRALKKSPHFVPALVNRASDSLFRGEYDAARLDIEHAIKLNPILPEAYVVKGVYLKKTGQFTQAELAMQKAIMLDPENGYARYGLGTLKAQVSKDHGEALRLFNEVLQVKKSEAGLIELAKRNIESLQQSRIDPNN